MRLAIRPADENEGATGTVTDLTVRTEAAALCIAKDNCAFKIKITNDELNEIGTYERCMSIKKDTRKPSTNYPHHRKIFSDQVVVTSLRSCEKEASETLIISLSATRP